MVNKKKKTPTTKKGKAKSVTKSKVSKVTKKTKTPTKSKVTKKVPSTKKVVNEKKPVEKKGDNKLIIFIAYLLGILSFIIYLIKKEDSEIKFHSLQSIVLNVIVFIYYAASIILSGILGSFTFGICSILFIPLMIIPVIYYLYVFYKVLTEGDIKIPFVTDFVKKNLKNYF